MGAPLVVGNYEVNADNPVPVVQTSALVSKAVVEQCATSLSTTSGAASYSNAVYVGNNMTPMYLHVIGSAASDPTIVIEACAYNSSTSAEWVALPAATYTLSPASGATHYLVVITAYAPWMRVKITQSSGSGKTYNMFLCGKWS